MRKQHLIGKDDGENVLLRREKNQEFGCVGVRNVRSRLRTLILSPTHTPRTNSWEFFFNYIFILILASIKDLPRPEANIAQAEEITRYFLQIFIIFQMEVLVTFRFKNKKNQFEI